VSPIDVERHGAVGAITINRPNRMNSLDFDAARDFRCAGLQLARNADVRAVVVRGLPGMFCAGADLKAIRGHHAAGGSYGAAFKEILEYLHSAISEIRRAPKPFIAAVDGVAAAGGFGLAMSCDLVVASPRATFEWAYGKTALTGAESTTFLLPRLIGLRRSMELVLLNPRWSASEALQHGLVTEVFAGDEFDEHVMAVAQRIAAGPTHAFAAAKELMNQAAGMDRLDAHLDRELETLTRAVDAAECAEGLAAFYDKRQAVYA
jgi:2-(1,2-epoxy-1,2-dihydrophenyl)acetyl-CoA isomerase